MLRLPVRLIVLASLLCAASSAGNAAGEEAAAPASPIPPLAVKVDDGLVSVDIRNALLGEVLRAIAGQAAIQLTIYSGATDRVTESFSDVNLDEAFQRLAQGYDVVLVYGRARDRGGPDHLVEVRVYEASTPGGPGGRILGPREQARSLVDARERGARLQNVRSLIEQAQKREPGALASLAEILANDPDPIVRQIATAGFAGIRTPEAVAALTTALGDQEPSVRIAAVSSLGVMRDDTQAPVIGQVLTRDTDAGVRRAAVRALATLRSDEAHRALEAAVSDPDASVRQAAQGALNRWARQQQAN